MKNMRRVRQQRKINHYIRTLNMSLSRDPLWKGRFCARQVQYWWEDWSDFHKDDGIIRVKIDFYDKQKHIHEYHFFTYSDIAIGWHLWTAINNFIIETCKVWDEHPTRETTIDYRNVEYEREM